MLNSVAMALLALPVSVKISYITYLVIGATTAFLVFCMRPAKPFRIRYLVSGLHCPSCTSAVEKSVKSIVGVQSVEVDWRTKNAHIEFDEQKVTAKQIAERIAGTSHMMGTSMSYSGVTLCN